MKIGSSFSSGLWCLCSCGCVWTQTARDGVALGRVFLRPRSCCVCTRYFRRRACPFTPTACEKCNKKQPAVGVAIIVVVSSLLTGIVGVLFCDILQHAPSVKAVSRGGIRVPLACLARLLNNSLTRARSSVLETGDACVDAICTQRALRLFRFSAIVSPRAEQSVHECTASVVCLLCACVPFFSLR